jgi:hypothetical protein
VRQTLAAAAVLLATEAPVLSSFVILAHSAAQAEQSHHPEVIPYTPSQHPVRTRHKDNHGTFCKSK